MSNLLDEREKRTKNRKKIKSEIDALINLSVDVPINKVRLASRDAIGDEITHRLLDEGAILYADGQIESFIAKGTLEKYLNGQNEHLKDADGNVRNLTEDYIGTVNYGHHDLATDPISIIGEWSKDDLHLVDIENGRKALDVDLRLNENHIYVKQLKEMPYDVGLSAEFWCHYDGKMTAELGFPVIDEIFMGDFAVVGECGNVNSSDLRLKGGLEMPKDKELTLDEIIETEPVEEVVEEVVEETEKGAEIEEMSAQEASAVEETEEIEEETESEEEVIDNEDEPVEEAVEEVESEEDEDIVSKLMEAVKSMQSEIVALKEHINAQNKTMNRLRKKLKARNEEAKDFLVNFKGLSVEMGITKEEPKEVGVSASYLTGDGIGE